MSSSYTDLELDDLKELYRVYDFGKFKIADRLAENAQEKKQSADDLFAELYDLYQIKQLPDRKGAIARLREAVPQATEAEVVHCIRVAEIKSFNEPDALRSLQRLCKSRPRENVASPAGGGSGGGASTALHKDPAAYRFDISNVKTEAERNAFVHLKSVTPNAPPPSAAATESTGTVPHSPESLTKAPKREDLNKIMEEEVRAWVADMVSEAYKERVRSSEKFVDCLRDGVILHVLLQKMREPPVADEQLKIPQRTTGFFARDNVATFLQEAKATYQLNEAQTFTDSDLCDAKDDRQVITCLMAMARTAYSRGSITCAPQMVVFEKEIEARTKAYDDTDLQCIVDEAEERERQTQTQDEEREEGAREVEEEEEAAHEGSASHEEDPQNNNKTEDNEHEAEAVQEVEAAGDTAVAEERDAEPDAVAKPPVSYEHVTAKEEPAGEQTAADLESKDEKDETETDKETADTVKGGGGKVVYLRHGELHEDLAKPAQSKASSPLTRRVFKQTLTFHNKNTAPLPPRYISRRWDLIDVALGNVVNAHYDRFPQSPLRVHNMLSVSGEYVVHNRQNAQKYLLFVRLVQGRPLCRRPGVSGNDWIELDEVLNIIEK